MAYNPFNIFRRNQKALFAVLTVFIMLMFTLSFGAGDAIDRFSRWLGTRGGKGETVCTLDGDAIKSSEIERVRRGRVMANMFMSLAGAQAAAAAQEYANGLQNKLSPLGQRMVQQANAAAFSPDGVQGVRQSIGLILGTEGAKSEDKEAARAILTVLNLRERELLGAPGEGAHFFHNAPNRSTRDVIEFLLWEKKADKVGVHFTRDDVKAMLGREFSGFFQSDVRIRERLREQVAGFTMEDCLDALAIEFKVRAAQVAVLGPIARNSAAAPAYATPYELFEFYRQQCSPATYDVLAVPAAAYLGQVKGEPSRTELKTLYDKYANDEPNPGKEGFGFKDPRKLKIEWLAITGAEPYYTNLAEAQLVKGESAARALGVGLGVPLPGALTVAVAVGPALREPALSAEYDKYKGQFAFKRQNEYSGTSTQVRDLLDSSTAHPGTALAALGGAVGQATPFGSPAVAAALPVGYAFSNETRDRVRSGVLGLFAGVPGPAFLPTAVGQAGAFHLTLPEAPPVEALREELRPAALKARAAALAFGGRPTGPDAPGEKGDIARFTEELEKLTDKGKAKDPKALEAVRAYIEKFKAERGLTKPGEQFGASVGPRDEWSMEDDPGLKPLVDAHKLSLAQARGAHGGGRYIPFGRSFFWTVVPNLRGGEPQRVPTAGTFLARPFPPRDALAAPTDGQPRYVYWASEDVPAKKTLNLSTAEDKVKDVWRQLKARDLAKADAEAIAKTVRDSKAASEDTIRQRMSDGWLKVQGASPTFDEKVNRRIKRFTLDKVAPLVPVPLNELDPQTLQMMFQRGFDPSGLLMPFALNESENIPYPTPEMRKALLDARDQPVGTVLVLADAPKDTFYVATLVKRDLKTTAEFQRSVFAPGGPARNQIAGAHQQEAVARVRQAAVELLKKEFKYAETEEQKKKLDENTRSGTRD